MIAKLALTAAAFHSASLRSADVVKTPWGERLPLFAPFASLGCWRASIELFGTDRTPNTHNPLRAPPGIGVALPLPLYGKAPVEMLGEEVLGELLCWVESLN